MDFNKRWRRELQFNVIMLGLSSLACVLTALVRDPVSLPNEAPLRISQHVQTADVRSTTVRELNRQLTALADHERSEPMPYRTR